MILLIIKSINNVRGFKQINLVMIKPQKKCGCCSSAAAIYKLIFGWTNLRHLFKSGTYWNASLIGVRTVLEVSKNVIKLLLNCRKQICGWFCPVTHLVFISCDAVLTGNSTSLIRAVKVHSSFEQKKSVNKCPDDRLFIAYCQPAAIIFLKSA